MNRSALAKTTDCHTVGVGQTRRVHPRLFSVNFVFKKPNCHFLPDYGKAKRKFIILVVYVCILNLFCRSLV